VLEFIEKLLDIVVKSIGLYETMMSVVWIKESASLANERVDVEIVYTMDFLMFFTELF